MLIRYGYEITINSPQPTPLVCLLVGERRSEGRHTRRREGLHDADHPDHHLSRHVRQSLPQTGRACRRLRNLGRRHDRRRWQDRPGELCRTRSPRRGAARRLPALSHGQPILRDRQAEPDGLGPVRQYPARLGARAGGVRFRPSAHQVRLSAGAIDQKRVRRLPGADRRLPRFRASRGDASADASTFPRATSTAISATSACRWSIRWISAPGSRCSSRDRGGLSILATTCRGSAGSWSREAGTRRISRSSTRSDPTS